MKCPVCGYNDDPKAKIANTLMTEYVDKNGKTKVLQSTEEKVEAKNDKGEVVNVYTRKDKVKVEAKPSDPVKQPVQPTK